MVRGRYWAVARFPAKAFQCFVFLSSNTIFKRRVEEGRLEVSTRAIRTCKIYPESFVLADWLETRRVTPPHVMYVREPITWRFAYLPTLICFDSDEYRYAFELTIAVPNQLYVLVCIPSNFKRV